MKVLHVTNAYPYPGIPEFGVFVKEQIDALRRAGVDADVMFINGSGEGRRAYLDAIPKLRARAPDYDVIHCHHVYSAFVAALARVRRPVVVSFQNAWLREVEIPFVPVQAVMCEIGARYADRVIFKSPIPEKFAGQDKFVHLPNGVDQNTFVITDKAAARERLGLDAEAAYVLFTSSKYRDRPQKRYDRFTETMDRVRQRIQGRDVRELLLVNQPREKVLDFLNAADVHLLCSDYEGSPNSVKEALSCGLPVVATKVGNVEEMMSGVPACAVAETFEPAELATLVESSISAGANRSEVRDAFLQKGLNQQMTTRRLTELYTEMLANAPRRD